MQQPIRFFAVLLALALGLNAGCMYTINGNPDVNLLTVHISPLHANLLLLDSGDRASPLILTATMQGFQSSSAVTWTLTQGGGGDSIVSDGGTARYYLPNVQQLGNLQVIVRATSVEDFSRFAQDTLMFNFPSGGALAVVPMGVTLIENSTQQLGLDTMVGHTLSNVTWSIASGPGSVTQSGLFVAPSSITTDSAITIVQASSGSDTAQCTVTTYRSSAVLRCFTRDVQPILVSCEGSGCHGGAGGSRPIFNYQETRRNVKPGDARASRLYQIITELNGDNRMPPPPAPALSQQQVLTIGQWIDQGALDCQ